MLERKTVYGRFNSKLMKFLLDVDHRFHALRAVHLLSPKEPWRLWCTEREIPSAESDHFTYLNTYIQWEKHKCSSKWCTDNFILGKAMQKMREVRSQLVEIMETMKMEIYSSGTDWYVVRKCICSAYFYNAARYYKHQIIAYFLIYPLCSMLTELSSQVILS